jgi:hypothetical protein
VYKVRARLCVDDKLMGRRCCNGYISTEDSRS